MKMITAFYYLRLWLIGAIFIQSMFYIGASPQNDEKQILQRFGDLDEPHIEPELDESDSVKQLLDSTEDYEIPQVVSIPPSDAEVFLRKWGIYLLYKYHDYKYWILGTSFCAFCYYLGRNTWRS